MTSYIPVPEAFYQALQAKNSVLLESIQPDAENNYSIFFTNPVHILQIYQVSELSALLEQIEMYSQQGYYLAGYFAYECGYSIPKLGLASYCSTTTPLAWFGVYQDPLIFDHLQSSSYGQLAPQVSSSRADFALYSLQFDLSESEYIQKVEKVQDYILAGDVYQINLTGRYRFRFTGSSLALYQGLKRRQRVSYGAYLRTEQQDIISLSPELFFRLNDRHLLARPMKGTAPRGRTLAEDRALATWLQHDQKNRAENVMIVDLLRNDLGRICHLGSVQATRLFTIERYNTLHQMTSTVTGQLTPSVGYRQVFESLFPCGSITGAPKIRAMEIIHELEASPRGIYTGAIGYFGPQQAGFPLARTAVFNVAIRTITLQGDQGEMGVGSGIVYDSKARDEYHECLTKARFLTERPAFSNFDILEAILWDNDYHHLDRHLHRMGETASYFGYPYDQALLRHQLAQLSRELQPGARYKVRILLKANGQFQHEALCLPETPTQQHGSVILSSIATDSHNPLYFHKTTSRNLYQQATRFAQEHGKLDVIFLNERGEVTEGAVHNIFIEKDGMLFTPPVSCGLLNGIYRQTMLDIPSRAQEEVLSMDDLLQAEAIYLCNAIRGWRKVRLDQDLCFS